ncbi:uncharacterized protein LOC127710657 [Mytilus californianus]|uniref:uncharacterized protein LOC127710657 n=1 Tax=Mytilus californianus TaxID=6549 RepID=UPI002247315F|nr:uncharacterized protein LOC127710657 [Mytilus californianus]
MEFTVILILIFGIGNSLQLDGTFCKNATTGSTKCCYNHEEVNGVCKQCRNGTSAEAGGQCKPCKENMFGYKCIATCNCDHLHSCDAVVGCITNTSFLTENTTDAGISSEGSTSAVILSTGVHVTTQERAVIHSKITTTRKIETDKLITDVPNNVFTTKEPNSISSGGSSNMEWLIYTLCIVGVVIVTGLSHLFRSYRKRKHSKEMLVNGDLVLEQVIESPYSGFYDEIDENMLADDKTYFVPQDNHSATKSTGHDDTGYLDACFATEEDEQQKLKDKLSQKGSNSTSSSNSHVAAQNDTEYLHPYHTLQDNWKEDSHGYEAAVTVHHRTESSSGSDEESTNPKYSHVYQPLQKDRDMKGQAYEKPQTPKLKTVNDAKAWEATPSSALSHKGSSPASSSSSDVADDTEYLNPNHTLQDNWETNSHEYKVAMTVNPGTETSSGSDEETTYHKYSHVYQPLQKDRDMKGHAYEKPQTTKLKNVNDAKVREATQSRHGTSSLQDNVNNNVDSDKTMNSCDEMEAINHKQDYKKPSNQIKSKTNEKEIFRDE